jgi:plastocyanin
MDARRLRGHEVRRALGRALAALAAVAALGPVASASAAERIVAIPQSTYATQNVAIDQGEPLTFLNLDALGHDVTARGKAANGDPLFSTPIIGTGQEVPVTGADSLSPGDYAFFCTIHPQMEGTLKVGGGGGGSGDPAVEIEVLDKKISEVRKSGALRVSMDVDRGAKMKVTASVKVGGDNARLGKASHDFPEAGSHTMQVPLSSAGRKALKGADSAKVTVTGKAEDAAGNTGSASASAKLR